MFTLGNIGQSSIKCLSAEISLSDSMRMWCPTGAEMSGLEELGLQNPGT